MKFFNCREVSENYIYGLNALIGFCTLVIALAGGVTRGQYGDGVDEAFEEGGIDMSFGILGGIFAFCFLGFIGLRKKNEWCLGIFLFLSFCLAIILTVKVAYVNVFVHSVNEITEEPIEEVDDFEAIATEGLLAIYETCCVDSFGAPPPTACDENNTIACISDSERFQDIIDIVPDSICGELAQEAFNGVPLVGNLTEGGCGGGDAEVFIDSLGKHVSELLESFGYVAGVFTLVILLAEVSLLVIFFQKRKEYFHCFQREDDENTAKVTTLDTKPTELV